jgi:hypothetical protein
VKTRSRRKNVYYICIAGFRSRCGVYTTRELAEAAAVRMGLHQYEIAQVFAKGERVIFREAETGPEELGTVRGSVMDKFYDVTLDDGTLLDCYHTELSSAPVDAPPAPASAEIVTAAQTEPDNSHSEKEPKADDLSAALLATIKEYAEYDHPCDYDKGDLSKAHGTVSIHVLRELLARHS